MRTILVGVFAFLFIGAQTEKSPGNTIGMIHILPKRDSVLSSNLPLVIINTGHKKIRENKKVNAGMGIIYKGEGLFNRATDPFNQYSGNISIGELETLSKSFPKKSYNLQTIDEMGRLRYVSLLGLPSECDWVLYAPYNDKTLMRDVIAYRIAREMNRYATNTVYVELILNGHYKGVYILEEKIKRSPVRININATSGTESPIQNGFILRIGKSDEESGIFNGPMMTKIIGKSHNIFKNKKEVKPITSKKQNICSQAKDNYFKSAYTPTGSKWQEVKFNYYDPQKEELSLQNRLDICNFMYLVESSLQDPFTTKMDSGYHRYIDMESFIDYFILNEVTKNMEGYRLNAYIYKSSGIDKGRIFMGPPWDFNTTMGNVDYCEGYLPTGWAYEYNGICSDGEYLVPFWWERIMDDPIFRDNLKCRWNSLRQSSLATENVIYVMDSISNVLNDSPSRNFKRWKVLGKNISPNKYVFKSYLEEIAFLKNWLTERLEWLDRNMPGNCPAIPPSGFGNK